MTLTQFLVGAASSREKKSRYRHHHMIAAGIRSYKQNRINIYEYVYSGTRMNPNVATRVTSLYIVN